MLAAKIRAETPETPIILVADPDSDCAALWQQAGFDDCLYRPLSREQLYDVIGRFLPSPTSTPAVETNAGDLLDGDIASVESLLDRLPELASGVREVFLQSDMELLTRFAELFFEIGHIIGQDMLVEKASRVLACMGQDGSSLQELTAGVDQLCELCHQIHLSKCTDRPTD